MMEFREERRRKELEIIKGREEKAELLWLLANKQWKKKNQKR
jgi:hypothetical protein